MSPREVRDSVVGVMRRTEDRARDMGASNGTSPASTVLGRNLLGARIPRVTDAQRS
jgi:hypothetical protein